MTVLRIRRTPRGQGSQPAGTTAEAVTTKELGGYFLRLGSLGFGGPVALAGAMHRDLVERRRWVDEEEYRLGMALSQIMPGPLAAQLAVALGYLTRGLAGATVAGIAFVLPSFLFVVALAVVYEAYGGLWWMQALFYGVGAAVIAIIAGAALRLARSTNRRDPLLWGIAAVVALITAVQQAELAEAFIVAGLPGAIAAAAGIFVPVYILTIVPAPWIRRHRDNPQLRAFVLGATAAATGAIAGAVVVLAGRSIVDAPTLLIALVAFVLIWRVRTSEPVLVLTAGVAGLALWPLA